MATVRIESFAIRCDVCGDVSPVMHKVVSDQGEYPHPESWNPGAQWQFIAPFDRHKCLMCANKQEDPDGR